MHLPSSQTLRLEHLPVGAVLVVALFARSGGRTLTAGAGGAENLLHPATAAPQLFKTLHMAARLLVSWNVAPKGGAEKVTLLPDINASAIGPLGLKPLP